MYVPFVALTVCHVGGMDPVKPLYGFLSMPPNITDVEIKWTEYEYAILKVLFFLGSNKTQKTPAQLALVVHIRLEKPRSWGST